jgi:Tfp pilus assembly protein PilO
MKGTVKLLVFLIVAIIIIVVYVFLIHSRTSKEIAKLKDTFSTVSDSLSQARQIANRLPETQREYNFLKKQWDVAQGMLPVEKATEQLLSLISKSATGNNIKILGFKPNKLKKEKNFQAYPMSIKMLGKYHKIGKFFSDVGNFKRIIRIGDIRMSWDDQAEGVVTDFTATSYVYVGSRTREGTSQRQKEGGKK